MLGLITKEMKKRPTEKRPYLGQIDIMTTTLSISKMKVLVMDYRNLQEGEYLPIHINRAIVEKLAASGFLVLPDHKV